MTGPRQDIFRCMIHVCTSRGQSSLPCSKQQRIKNVDTSKSSRIMHPKLCHAPSVLTVHRSWTTVPVLPTWQRACDLCIARPLSLATLPTAIPNLSFGRSRQTRATPTLFGGPLSCSIKKRCFCNMSQPCLVSHNPSGTLGDQCGWSCATRWKDRKELGGGLAVGIFPRRINRQNHQ